MMHKRFMTGRITASEHRLIFKNPEGNETEQLRTQLAEAKKEIEKLKTNADAKRMAEEKMAATQKKLDKPSTPRFNADGSPYIPAVVEAGRAMPEAARKHGDDLTRQAYANAPQNVRMFPRRYTGEQIPMAPVSAPRVAVNLPQGRFIHEGMISQRFNEKTGEIYWKVCTVSGDLKTAQWRVLENGEMGKFRVSKEQRKENIRAEMRENDANREVRRQNRLDSYATIREFDANRTNRMYKTEKTLGRERARMGFKDEGPYMKTQDILAQAHFNRAKGAGAYIDGNSIDYIQPEIDRANARREAVKKALSWDASKDPDLIEGIRIQNAGGSVIDTPLFQTAGAATQASALNIEDARSEIKQASATERTAALPNTEKLTDDVRTKISGVEGTYKFLNDSIDNKIQASTGKNRDSWLQLKDSAQLRYDMLRDSLKNRSRSTGESNKQATAIAEQIDELNKSVLAQGKRIEAAAVAQNSPRQNVQTENTPFTVDTPENQAKVRGFVENFEERKIGSSPLVWLMKTSTIGDAMNAVVETFPGMSTEDQGLLANLVLSAIKNDLIKPQDVSLPTISATFYANKERVRAKMGPEYVAKVEKFFQRMYTAGKNKIDQPVLVEKKKTEEAPSFWTGVKNMMNKMGLAKESAAAKVQVNPEEPEVTNQSLEQMHDTLISTFTENGNIDMQLADKIIKAGNEGMQSGNENAAMLLADVYFMLSKQDTPDRKKYHDQMLKMYEYTATEQHNGLAAMFLGQEYFKPQTPGIAPDYKQSIKWFKQLRRMVADPAQHPAIDKLIVRSEAAEKNVTKEETTDMKKTEEPVAPSKPEDAASIHLVEDEDAKDQAAVEPAKKEGLLKAEQQLKEFAGKPADEKVVNEVDAQLKAQQEIDLTGKADPFMSEQLKQNLEGFMMRTGPVERIPDEKTSDKKVMDEIDEKLRPKNDLSKVDVDEQLKAFDRNDLPEMPDESEKKPSEVNTEKSAEEILNEIDQRN